MFKKSILIFCGLLSMGFINNVAAENSYKVTLANGTNLYLSANGNAPFNVTNENDELIGTIEKNETSNQFDVKNNNEVDLGSAEKLNPDALEILNSQ